MPRMRDTDRKLFENPDELTDKELENVTFASHMSYLTNKRLHELFSLRDINGVQAGTFKMDAIMLYGASLQAIYKEVECVLSETERSQLLFLFEKYSKMVFRANADIRERFMMYDILSTIHRFMNSYLQNRQFFFRLESQPLKGIRNTLKRLGWADDAGVPGVVEE
jgi:hypothetical protein